MALAEANPKLVVVNVSGSPVAMPWVDRVPAIVQTWYNGSEAGNSLAAVLMGDVNPSGKLPFTFPARIEDVGAHALGDYHAKGSRDTIDIRYNEGIFVGYRWADRQKKTKPLFPFGYGLSYTTFEYGRPTIDRKTLTADGQVTVSVSVKNTGEREGQEIVQLYVSDKKASVERPVKELKGFKKVALAPGEEKTVTFTIGRDALCFFDATKHEWVAEPGRFEALIAASAADIKGKVAFDLE